MYFLGILGGAIAPSAPPWLRLCHSFGTSCRLLHEPLVGLYWHIGLLQTSTEGVPVLLSGRHDRRLHRRRRRGQGGTCPSKFGRIYFSGNYYVQFGHFSGKNRVKFRNFVNFSGKWNKNSGILIIFWARIMWISGILLIFHTYFSGKNVVPP